MLTILRYLRPPLSLANPPPNPHRNHALRRQRPHKEITHIGLRLPTLGRAQLNIIAGDYHGQRGHHLVLGKEAARTHAHAAAKGHPPPSQTFHRELRVALLHCCSLWRLLILQDVIVWAGYCPAVCGILLHGPTGRVVGIDEEALSPKLVERMRVFVRAVVPQVLVAGGGLAAEEDEVAGLEEPLAKLEIVLFGAAHQDDGDAKTQRFRVDGLQEGPFAELGDVESWPLAVWAVEAGRGYFGADTVEEKRVADKFHNEVDCGGDGVGVCTVSPRCQTVTVGG